MKRGTQDTKEPLGDFSSGSFVLGPASGTDAVCFYWKVFIY
jgi:hypothetical protein